MPDRPPGDPREILRIWMEWERGETTPGTVLANLKRAGARELIEALAEQLPAPSEEGAGDGSPQE